MCCWQTEHAEHLALRVVKHVVKATYIVPKLAGCVWWVRLVVGGLGVGLDLTLPTQPLLIGLI